MNLLVNLFVITSLYIIGILIFTSGFLLRRTVIGDVSECDEGLLCNSNNGSRIKKAVVLIIDALRYDFLTLTNNSEEGHVLLPYQNNFIYVNTLINSQPNNAKLYKFVADPPTTTLQRLKGLTTGSLPTFVDAGSNFDKEEISEDNFLDQLVRKNKTIAFVGDDTWMGLFPNRFADFKSYPSFNVKDLDTVDYGVIDNFDKMIHHTNWSLLIGHMLGVDHCGHTFGPHHNRMKEKLMQMDSFIRNITESLDNDTILFVMGDHGMTKTGDHGGDSDEEVDAGLFIYSKTPFGGYGNGDNHQSLQTISQVDLVPTLSLLLGVPIPFQNLGIIIPELFLSQNGSVVSENRDVSFKSELEILLALYNNAEQMAKYIRTYLNYSSETSSTLTKLLDDYEMLRSNYSDYIRDKNHNLDGDVLKKMIDGFLKFMKSVRNNLRGQWAKFDGPSMFIGVLFVFLTLFLNLSFIILESLSMPNQKTLGFIFLVMCFFIVDSAYRYMVGFVLAINLIVTTLFTAYRFCTEFSKSLFSFVSVEQVFSIVVWLGYLASLFSNSFVVYENLSTQFLLQSTIYFQLFCTVRKYLASQIRNSYQKQTTNPFKRLPVIYSDFKIHWKRPVLDLTLYSLLINVSIFISQYFQTCREEQVGCTDLYSFKLLADDKNVLLLVVKNKLTLAVIMTFVLTYAVYRWLCKNGSLNGWSPANVIGRYLLFFIAALISLHWLLISVSMLNTNQKNTFHFYTKIASAICLLVSVSVSILICCPLCLFSLKRSHLKEERDAMNLNVLNNLILTSNNSKTIVPLLYNHLKSQWLNKGKDEDEKYNIYVYGLATVYSSSVIILLTLLSLLLMMILGFQTAPSVFLLLLIIFFLLNSHSCHNQLNGKGILENIPTTMIITSLLLASEHFYSVGHHPAIASIKWDSVYYILEGDDNPHVLISLILYLNTYASHIIIALALPLFVYWPLSRDVMDSKPDSKKSSDADSRTDSPRSLSNSSAGGNNDDSSGENPKGEYILNDEADKMRSLFYQLSFKALFFLALKVLVMMLCVTLHRRHLMVWKIFAPRFVYEVAGFIVISVVIFFNYLFALRTKKAVDRFISKSLK